MQGTLVTDILSGRPCMRRVALRVVAGEDQGVSAELGELSVLIGTHPDTDLVVRDPLVSRRHVEVRLTADGVEVRDLGSKNGTFVGDAKVDRAVVAPGGSLRLGDTTIAIEALDEPLDLGDGQEAFGGLTTRSPRMREVYALLDRVAGSDASLLLEGETGVGKDVIARTVHEQSDRREGPFLVLDCGSVSRELLSSELFGHRRGAFTGAMSDRAGLFEAAKGGTVFLDELGELSPELQPALLRVLENRQVTRVGETRPRDVDVRVLAATNRSLHDEVAAGRFREDLFFRLAVVQVHIPPLRERPEDIADLARRFLDDLGRPGQLTEADALALAGHAWPGNVRELKNVVERSALLSADRFVLQLPRRDGTSPTHRPLATESGEGPRGSAGLPVGDLLGLPFKEAKAAALARFEAHYLEERLVAEEGNVSRLAERVGLARAYVHRLLTRHGIDREKTRGARAEEEA